MSRCAVCGGPDCRHRVVDTQQERVIAGEPIDVVAADWDQTPAEMVQTWADAYGRALDGWTEAERLEAERDEAREHAEEWCERACFNEPPNSDWEYPGQHRLPWEPGTEGEGT